MLRPHLFWRPLEVLNRFVAGKLLFFYPGYFHLCAAVAHGACMFLIWRLLTRTRATPSVRTAGIALFAIAPGLVAPLWSVDGAAQIWSTAFGLAATLSLARGRRYGWLFWLVLAALAKESGLGWSVAAPMIVLAVEGGRSGTELETATARSLGTAMLGAAAVVAVYFVARSLLVDPEGIPFVAGRYQLQFSPWSWLRNAAMIIGVAVSTVDTVFLFATSGTAWLGAGLAGLGLPLLFVVIRSALKQIAPRTLGAWFVAILAIVGPHLPLGRVSEMYAHPLVALLTLLFASRLGETPAPSARTTRWAFSLALVGAFAVNAHKLSAMIETGERAREVGVRIAAQVNGELPTKICAVVPKDWQAPAYSVFLASPGPASAWGLSVRSQRGYRNPYPGAVRRVKRRADCPAAAEMVLRFSKAGQLVGIAFSGPETP